MQRHIQQDKACALKLYPSDIYAPLLCQYTEGADGPRQDMDGRRATQDGPLVMSPVVRLSLV